MSWLVTDGLSSIIEGFGKVASAVNIFKTIKETGVQAMSELKAAISDAVKGIAQMVGDVFNSIAQSISNYQAAEIQQRENHYAQVTGKLQEQRDAELETLNEKSESELAALESKYQRGLMGEEQYNALKEQKTKETSEKEKKIKEDADKKIIEQEKKKKKEIGELKKKQFESEKALAIATIWVQAAIAIVSFWASLASMGIAGIVLAAVATALVLGMAVAQTVIVANQQFPGYATGGMIQGNQTVRVNEEGGEIITLPDGSQVIPNDISRQIASSLGQGERRTDRPINLGISLPGGVVKNYLIDTENEESIMING